MESLTMFLKHVPSAREQPCGGCGADFVPSEDSGSRVLSIRPAGEEPLGALLCGGCFSKWIHAQPMTLRPNRAS